MKEVASIIQSLETRMQDDLMGHRLTWNVLAMLFVAFMLSGTCALAYQVVWTRMLSLVFGSTHQAIATVLAMFMLGLALGSFLGGKLVLKVQNSGRAYGVIEIVLGCYALAFSLILKAISTLYWQIYPQTYDVLLLDSLARLALAALILLPPTILMGATLPLLAQFVESKNEKLGQRIGWLYGINTIGAACGAFVSAFYMIPYYGLQVTINIFAIINIVIGIGCILVLQPLPPVAPETRQGSKKKTRPKAKTVHNISVPLLLMLLFLTGAVGMLLENGWSHALVLVFGTSVYAFATMLTTYLVGLASGCFVASRFLQYIRSAHVLAWLLVANGLAIGFSTPVIGALPGWFVSIFGNMQAQWHVVMAKEFLACAALMFVPTFLNGALFPICLHFIAQSQQRKDYATGKNTAYAYVWNTSGSILGALVAGFILIPFLGTERCLLLAAALVLLAAALVFWQEKEQSRLQYVLAGCMGLGALATPFAGLTWDAVTMNSGVYVYSRFFEDQSALAQEMKNFKLVYYKEGSASVAVFESSQGDRFLRVNGKTDGSSEGDNTTQMLLGYLPYLYAQELEKSLVIGFGTGITSGCVLDLPVASLESIEISAEVLGAAPWFEDLNSQVFTDERSIIRELDGRTWLSAMPITYDMIISEPSNPWQTGNANLFTTEFFHLAAQRLTASGVLCQWLPYYNMDSSHFRLILASLKSVFPHTHLWMSATDTFLISSKQPLVINMDRITALFENSSSSKKLHDIGIVDKNALLSFYYLDNEALDKMIEGITLQNTDAFPIVEFHSPKYLLGPNRPDIFFAILEESYQAAMPVAHAGGYLDTFGRILSRRGFYENWRIPQQVTDQMVQRAMAQ
jgi:spermidine synthase